MAEQRYTLTDVEALAAHLATVLARHADGQASATAVADVALGWAADHGWRPEADVRRQVEADIELYIRRESDWETSWMAYWDGMRKAKALTAQGFDAIMAEEQAAKEARQAQYRAERDARGKAGS
jgi:hypothetical protein